MPYKPVYDNRERLQIGCVILMVFLGLAGLMFFQFALHYSQTKDLQRRVGTIEQQIESESRK